jgi:hypothetical protein
MHRVENTIDPAAARRVVSGAATLIDLHRVANPTSDRIAGPLTAVFAEAQAQTHLPPAP